MNRAEASMKKGLRLKQSFHQSAHRRTVRGGIPVVERIVAAEGAAN
ncbi:MAG: hypothetical protein V2A66_00790 [Pseudomonadota bacterium]